MSPVKRNFLFFIFVDEAWLYRYFRTARALPNRPRTAPKSIKIPRIFPGMVITPGTVALINLNRKSSIIAAIPPPIIPCKVPSIKSGVRIKAAVAPTIRIVVMICCLAAITRRMLFEITNREPTVTNNNKIQLVVFARLA